MTYRRTVRAHPITEEQLAFISTPDAKLYEGVARLSFDRARMASRVDGGPWQLVVQAHLYHDHILTLILNENLSDPKALNLDRMSFAHKMDLARALALVPDELSTFWRKLNKVRNSIAHDLEYEVTDQEISGLKQALPEFIKAASKPGGFRPDRPQTLQEVLITTVFAADQVRQRLAGDRLVDRKRALMVLATVAGQDFPLNDEEVVNFER